MPSEMAPAEIAEAQRLCDRATAGPWRRDERYVIGGEGIAGSRPGGEVIAQASPSRTMWGGYTLAMRVANAALIAASRTLLPRALRTIDARDAEIGRLRGLLLRAHPVLQDRMMWAPEGATLGDDAEVARLVSEIDAELAREVATSDA